MNSELFLINYKQDTKLDVVDLLAKISNDSELNEEDSELMHKIGSYIVFLRDEIDNLNCELDNDHIGGTFDEFLIDEDMLDEREEMALEQIFKR